MAEKTTEELLADYGYVQVPGDKEGSLYRPARLTSDRWVKVKGGWESYATGLSAIGGARPWGRECPLPGLVQVPWRQTEQFANASGLHPAEQPEAFEWVWPDEVVNQMFLYAAPVDADGQILDNPWVKVDDGEGNVTFEKVK